MHCLRRAVSLDHRLFDLVGDALARAAVKPPQPVGELLTVSNSEIAAKSRNSR